MRLARRTKLVLALAGSFLLLAQSAGATHELNFSFTMANTNKDANSNVTSHNEPGAYLPKDMTFHLPPGVLLAHADDARRQEPIGSGAPAGTVAQIDVSNAIGFTTTSTSSTRAAVTAVIRVPTTTW